MRLLLETTTGIQNDRFLAVVEFSFMHALCMDVGFVGFAPDTVEVFL